MFALIRHAEYEVGTGNLSLHGEEEARKLGEQLLKTQHPWHQIMASPTPRSRETAKILSSILQNIPVVEDKRLSTNLEIAPYFPDHKLTGLILVSHLPVLTKLLRTYSRSFGQEEPPLLPVGHAYLVNPQEKTIISVIPRGTEESLYC